MKTLSTLLIDDEPIPRQILKDYCNKLGIFHLVDEAQDAIVAINKISEQKYDVLFLDINMPLLNGISLLKSLPVRPQIILVTAYSEYAVEAFELEVLDYLVKPVSFERFLKAVMKVKAEEQTEPLSPPSAVAEERIIEVKQNGKVFRITLDEIIYMEAMGNLTKIQLANGNMVQSYIPLSKLLETVPYGFLLRIHRSYAINGKKITAFDKKRVYMDTFSAPIGDYYRADLDKHLKLMPTTIRTGIND